jgi:hypothetical protein
MQKLRGSIQFATEMKDIVSRVKLLYTSLEAKRVAEIYQVKYCEHAVRDSVVGIAIVLWTGWCGVRIPQRRKISVLQNVRTCYGAGPASSSMSVYAKCPGCHVGN